MAATVNANVLVDEFFTIFLRLVRMNVYVVPLHVMMAPK
jgi:hypothetical protein